MSLKKIITDFMIKKLRRILLVLIMSGVFLPAILTVCRHTRAAVSTEDLSPHHMPVLPHNATQKTVSPEMNWPHTHSDFKPDPSVVFGELPNGFRYVLMPHAEPRDRVSMHLNVQAGSLHETEAQRGLAHFLEHLLFCGSTHFPPGELIAYFQSIGMQFGADANAHTGFAETVYDVHLPDGRKASLEKGLLVMQDYAQGALLLPSEIDRERGVILAEKRTRDSAAYRTFEAALKFEFPEARISKRLPIGLEEVIRKADRPLIKSFYDTWYRPETMILVAVGDFDAVQAEKLIRQRFSGMQARSVAPSEPDIGIIRHKGIKSFYHYEKEAGKTNVAISVLQQQEPQTDTFDSRRRRLIRDMTDRMVLYRLEKLLDQAETPFTSVDVGSGTWLQRIRYAEISAECGAKQWKETLQLLEQHLRRALKYGFTDGELERVKKEYLSDLKNDVRQASTRKSTRLARDIIRSLNDNRVFLSPLQKQEHFAPVLKEVSLSTVNAAFKKNWSKDHRLLLVTGNARLDTDGTRSEDDITAVWHASQKTPVVAVSEQGDAIRFPYLPPPEGIGRMLQRESIEKLGIETVDFENGLRLNLKPTDFQSSQIVFTLAFGRGKVSEPLDRPGLAKLATAVINESGLGRMTRNDIKRALAGRETRIFFSVHEDYFAFSGTTVPAEIELFLQWLRTYILDPAYRPDARELVQERYDQKYQTLHRTVEGALTLYGNRFLAGGDGRFGLPSHENFRKNTLEDVQAWIHPALANSPLELSVVGDFDAQVMREQVQKYLATLPARTPLPPLASESSPAIDFPHNQTLTIVVPSRISKGLVKVAYPTDDFWDIRQTRRLTLLAQVFSENLRKKIRETLGAAYSPYAYNHSSRPYEGYGIFQAVTQVKPEQTEMIADEVRKIAAGLAENGVTEAALQLALKPVLTRLKDMRRDNQYWLDNVLVRSRRYPQQFAWSAGMMDDFAAITAKELSALARKYLDNDREAVVIVTTESGKNTEP
jgi:zinc protease